LAARDSSRSRGVIASLVHRVVRVTDGLLVWPVSVDLAFDFPVLVVPRKRLRAGARWTALGMFDLCAAGGIVTLPNETVNASRDAVAKAHHEFTID
jgi:hypothetical protein